MTVTEQIERKNRLPLWLRVERPGGEVFAETARQIHALELNTVCEEARCPNIGDCYSHRTATFMLLGDICTRGCQYCAVGKGKPGKIDDKEPDHVAEAVSRLGLKHVVLTSVDRDDLLDGGSSHFARTVSAIKERCKSVTIEVLIPDFRGKRELIRNVLSSPIDILNHNTETVPRLYPQVRGGGRYDWTMNVLRWAKEDASSIRTKSGLMLGLGETYEEIICVFKDLRDAGCEVLTLGQYLRPTRGHREVARFLPPEEFAELKLAALGFGFRHVESGPLVRSSYHAWAYAK